MKSNSGYSGRAFQFATGLTNFVTCLVPHCSGSQAVSLTFPTGFKFSYSGDCRPSQEFIDIGRGSTVLLHEATFGDDYKGDAKAKKHSTTSEAISVGKKMGARRILLTHFSQRYPKIPNLIDLEGGGKFEEGQFPDDIAEELSEIQVPEQDLMMDEVAETASQDEQNAYNTSSAAPVSTDLPTKPTFPDRSLTNSPIPSHSPIKDVKVGVGFDLMRVKVVDIMLLEKFNPAFMKLWEESEKSEKEKTEPTDQGSNLVKKPKSEQKKRPKEKKLTVKKESPVKDESSAESKFSVKNESPPSEKSPAKLPKPSLLQNANPS